jgi:hypothetical protein
VVDRITTEPLEQEPLIKATTAAPLQVLDAAEAVALVRLVQARPIVPGQTVVPVLHRRSLDHLSLVQEVAVAVGLTAILREPVKTAGAMAQTVLGQLPEMDRKIPVVVAEAKVEQQAWGEVAREELAVQALSSSNTQTR